MVYPYCGVLSAFKIHTYCQRVFHGVRKSHSIMFPEKVSSVALCVSIHSEGNVLNVRDQC